MSRREQAQAFRTGRERTAQRRGERLRQDYADAGLAYDPRIAAGRREIVVQDLGHTKRARTVDYGVLIRNKADRTPARIAAMERFDDLCHRAYSGLMPAPSFTPKVDGGGRPAAVVGGRIDGLREVGRLVERIGEDAQAILVHRVFHRMQFTAMATRGFGDERALTVLFLSAVDAVARFYGMAPPSAAVEAMHRELDGHALPNRAVCAS